MRAKQSEVREKIRQAALSRESASFACLMVEWNGARRRLPELCEELSIDPLLVHKYMHRRKWSSETALNYLASTTKEERFAKGHSAGAKKRKQQYAQKSGLIVNGEPVSFIEASRIVGMHSKTIRDYAKRHGITAQQAVDYYFSKIK